MTPRITPIQEELIVLMAATGIEPMLRPGPAALVTLPRPHDDHWREIHGGKPVKSNTVAALVRVGLLEREPVAKYLGYNVWRWRLTEEGRVLGASLSDSQ